MLLAVCELFTGSLACLRSLLILCVGCNRGGRGGWRGRSGSRGRGRGRGGGNLIARPSSEYSGPSEESKAARVLHLALDRCLPVTVYLLTPSCLQLDDVAAESALGFPLFKAGEDRLGWLFNMHTVRLPECSALL